MNRAAAIYYARGSARSESVALSFDGAHLTITANDWARVERITELRASARLARTRRVLHLPDGAQVHCDDNDAIDACFPRHGFDRLIDRLERHPHAIAASLVFTVAASVLFFTHGLPWLADSLAKRVPVAVERALGEQVLAALDKSGFAPSKLPDSRQTAIRGRFAANGNAIEFRSFGSANAFAIPGGSILVTDALVEAMSDDDGLAAVIAHEIGHHEHRHVMRSVLQSSAIVLLATLFAGDVSAATSVVIAVPTFLLQGHYSRDFEREADEFAFDYLEREGISPEWFAHALVSIGASDDTEGLMAYVSTHPSSADRIDEAIARSASFEPIEAIVAARYARADAPAVDDDIVGCWQGHQSDGQRASSSWWVQFAPEGELVAVFDSQADDRRWQTTYWGSWVVRRSTLTTRYRWAEQGDAEWQLDALHSYHIDEIDRFVQRYRSVDGAFNYESFRVPCESSDDEDLGPPDATAA